MNNKPITSLISYTFAAMSALCFLAGVTVLSQKGGSEYGQD